MNLFYIVTFLDRSIELLQLSIEGEIVDASDPYRLAFATTYGGGSTYLPPAEIYVELYEFCHGLCACPIVLAFYETERRDRDVCD